MRLELPEIRQYKRYDLRIVCKHLFLPCIIENKVRWLEKVWILQEYEKSEGLFDIITGNFDSLDWNNIRFLTEDEILEIKEDWIRYGFFKNIIYVNREGGIKNVYTL